MTEEKSTPMDRSHFSGKQLAMTFIAFFVIHSVVVYLANMFFPEDVVLGNHFFSPTMGLVYSMLPLTLLTVGCIPFIEYVAEKFNRTVSNMEWMVDYLLINTAGIWILARFAEWIGFGISSWMVAVALGVVITILQGAVMGFIMTSKPAQKS